MRGVIGFGQMLEIQLGIKLGGGNVGMAKHFLDCPQILSGLQNVTGKTMAQHVGVNMGRQTCQFDKFCELTLYDAWADPTTSYADKKCGVIGLVHLGPDKRRSCFEPACQAFKSLGADRDAASLATLAQNVDLAIAQVDPPC